MASNITLQKPKAPRSCVSAKKPAGTASVLEIMLVYFAFYGIIMLFRKLARSEEHE